MQVVPEGLRSSVYAFDRCFEGAISALSAPLVGLIAERWFGYTSDWSAHPSPARQLSNARALGNGLLVSVSLSYLSSSPQLCVLGKACICSPAGCVCGYGAQLRAESSKLGRCNECLLLAVNSCMQPTATDLL